jgi:hypothetical protein
VRHRGRQLPPTERAAFMFPQVFGSALPPAMATGLLALAREWHPDLLIHEQAEMASPLVAAVIGVPSVMQSYGGAVPPAILTEAADRLESLWRAYGLAIPAYAGCFDAPFLDICPPSVRPVPLTHVPIVQQLRPTPYAGPYQDGLVVPGGSDPLIYLTLGTIPGTTATLSAVLRALSRMSVRIIATAGPEADPAALGEQPAHIAVTRYVPQTQILRCATRSSPMPGPAPSSVPWPTDYPSSAYLRPRTSSATPTRACAQAPGSPCTRTTRRRAPSCRPRGHC